MIRPFARLSGLCLASLLAAASVAQAETFPARPVKLVVTFSPGGGVDASARLLAQKMGAELGQPMVIDNKPGAGGRLGTDNVAKSRPDGYTVLYATQSGLVINPLLSSSVPYEPIKDFRAVGMVGSNPLVLCVGRDSKFNTLSDLLAYAKAHPNELNYATAGVGTPAHLVTEWLKTQAGVNMTHVPYKGSSPGLTEIMSGQVQFFFAGVALAGPAVKNGTLKCLATTAPSRNSVLPQVPTMREAGIAGEPVLLWNALFVPAGTPPEIVGRLNKALNAAMKDKELIKAMGNLGLDTAPGTPEAMAAFLQNDTQRVRKLIVDAKIPRMD